MGDNLMAKARLKLKELTRRNQERNIQVVMEKVKIFIRGWFGYFQIADLK